MTEVLIRITVFFPSLNVVQVLYNWYIQVYHFQDPVAGFWFCSDWCIGKCFKCHHYKRRTPIHVSVVLVMGSSKSSWKVKEKQVKTKIKTNFDEKMYNP